MKYLTNKNNIAELGILTIAALKYCVEDGQHREALLLSVLEATKANWDLLTESDRKTVKQYMAEKTLALSSLNNSHARKTFMVTIEPSAHWISKFYEWIQRQEESVSNSIKELIDKELGDKWQQTAPSQLVKISTTWGDNNNKALDYLTKVCGAVALCTKSASGYVVISSKLPEFYIGQVIE